MLSKATRVCIAISEHWASVYMALCKLDGLAISGASTVDVGAARFSVSY